MKTNTIYIDDNLKILKQLVDEKHSFELIYIDPPYNSTFEGAGYSDVMSGVDWKDFIKQRVDLASGLLTHDGSIWFSIGLQGLFVAKELLDETNLTFITLITRETGATPFSKTAFAHTTDYVLVYSKCSHNQWIKKRNGFINQHEYRNHDNDPKGAYRVLSFETPNTRQNKIYPITTPTGIVHHPSEGRSWCQIESTYKKMLNNNQIYFGKDGSRKPTYKKYLIEDNGKPYPNLWDVKFSGNNKEAVELLKDETGIQYVGIKPLEFCEKMIEIATSKHDKILDLFAGSTNVCHTAKELNRSYIGIDISPETKKIAELRNLI